jgi:hypothetical protein
MLSPCWIPIWRCYETKTGRPAGHVGADGSQDLMCWASCTALESRGRIEQISGNLLAVNQGTLTLYPVLLKLEQEGCDRIRVGQLRE